MDRGNFFENTKLAVRLNGSLWLRLNHYTPKMGVGGGLRYRWISHKINIDMLVQLFWNFFHLRLRRRTGNKQGNPIMKAGLSCNSYRIFPVTGRNSNTCRMTCPFRLVPCPTLFHKGCFWEFLSENYLIQISILGTKESEIR